jgi:hypothetical protein
MLPDFPTTCAHGWAELSEVGGMLSQRKADFDTRSFGFKKLSKLLISGRQKELFEVQAIQDSNVE